MQQNQWKKQGKRGKNNTRKTITQKTKKNKTFRKKKNPKTFLNPIDWRVGWPNINHQKKDEL